MIILPEDKEVIGLLSPESAQTLLLALVSEGVDTAIMPRDVLIVYTVIKSRNDRISKKQSENGSKGGRPPKNPTEPTKAKQTQETQESHINPQNPTEPTKASVPNRTDTVPNRLEEEEEEDARAGDPHPYDPDTAAIVAAYESNVGPIMTSTERETLLSFITDLSRECLIYAFEEAALDPTHRNMRYVRGILNRLIQENAKTPEALRERIRRWEAGKAKAAQHPGAPPSTYHRETVNERNNRLLDDFFSGGEPHETGGHQGLLEPGIDELQPRPG